MTSHHTALDLALGLAPAEGVAVPEVAKVGDGDKAKRFLPFSDGRRDCAGQALAKMNVTAALAILLGHFHFDLTPEVYPRPPSLLLPRPATPRPDLPSPVHNIMCPCCSTRKGFLHGDEAHY